MTVVTPPTPAESSADSAAKPMQGSAMLRFAPTEHLNAQKATAAEPASNPLDAAAANRARVAKWRSKTVRIDYAPGEDVLAVITAVFKARPDLSKGEVIDSLVRAGHRAISGKAET